jgi:hypothetical protein
MSNLYREPFIDASYQVSVHLAKRFQSRTFLRLSVPVLVIPLSTCYWLFLSVPVTGYSSFYLILVIPLCTCY